MILFETKYNKIFNTTIHYLLINEQINNHDIGDIIEKIAPKYLRREQFQKCCLSFENLIEWIDDDYYHRLDCISKILLYNFLNNSETRQVLIKLKNFSTYNYTIEKLKRDYAFMKDEIEKNLYSIDWYLENLFSDYFILKIEKLYEENKLEQYLKNNVNIIPTYFDVLPIEIKQKFKVDDRLYKSIEELLEFLQDKIINGNLSYLFWDDDKPVYETKIQEILKTIIDAFFYKSDVDINRESIIGSGKIDFKFYKQKNEQVIFELKKASNSNLKSGYKTQIIKYMKSISCKRAYYIVLCFDEADIEKTYNFIKNKKKTDEYHNYVDIVIFDLRKRKLSLKNHNESLFNYTITEDINESFEQIDDIINLTKKDEFARYLKNLQSNFNKLNSIELKNTYINKLHTTITDKIMSKHFLSVFDYDAFYNIISSEDTLNILIMSLLRGITGEKQFLETIPEIEEFLSTICTRKNTEQITEEQINDIFKFLKDKHNEFYKILSIIKLRIYLLDEGIINFNSILIPTTNCHNCSILCTHMLEDVPRDVGYPIYVFFHMLGQTFNLWLTKSNTMVLDDFIEAMMPYTSNLKNNDEDAPILFADSVAMYLMHNTDYDRYNPFTIVSEDVYQKLDAYFKKLLKRCENDYISNG